MKPGFARAIVVCAAMLASSFASVIAIPTAKLADTRKTFDLAAEVPKRFAGWTLDESVVPLPPSPDQAQVLNEIYDQILSRTYVNDAGERMMLSITYGSKQNQQMRAHRQEVCYSAQGFRISDLRRGILQIGGGPIPATWMVASQGQRVEPVTYWFTMGDQVVLTYFEREWAQFRYALSGYIPDGYLVRVSSLAPLDPQAAFKRHVEFANDLLAAINPELRHRLTGHI